MPENITSESSHLNIFKLDYLISKTCKSVLYIKFNYYKLSIVKEEITVEYANKTVKINIHTTHLNRAIKVASCKTTSTINCEKVLYKKLKFY